MYYKDRFSIKFIVVMLIAMTTACAHQDKVTEYMMSNIADLDSYQEIERIEDKSLYPLSDTLLLNYAKNIAPLEGEVESLRLKLDSLSNLSEQYLFSNQFKMFDFVNIEYDRISKEWMAAALFRDSLKCQLRDALITEEPFDTCNIIQLKYRTRENNNMVIAEKIFICNSDNGDIIEVFDSEDYKKILKAYSDSKEGKIKFMRDIYERRKENI